MKMSLCLEYRGRGYGPHVMQPSVSEIVGLHVPPDPIAVVRIGKRSYLRGDTYDFREQLREDGFHWDSRMHAWWIGSYAQAEAAAKELRPHLKTMRPEKKYDTKDLTPNTDFADANKRLTYGLYFYFILESGRLYEVLNYVAWERTDYYYATPTQEGKLARVEDAASWLTANAR